VLLRYTNGARGVIIASQVAAGVENDLRLQVSGTLGTLTWRQEEPNQLVHSPVDAPAPDSHARLAVAVRIGTAGRPAACRPSGRHSLRLLPTSIWVIAADIRAHSAGIKADPTGRRLSRA
jgi:predicted dehydrogenase